MSNELLTNSTTAQGAVGEPTAGSVISKNTMDQMLNVLDSLLSHTHIFYDDYGTACNCNCNCNCACGTTRGTL